MKAAFLIPILIFFGISFSYAQEGYYYHTTEEETIPLALIDNKFAIEFIDSIPDTFNGVFLRENLYEIADTSGLDTLVIAYKLHPVYRLGEDIPYYLTSNLLLQFKQEITYSEKQVLINNFHLELVDSCEIFERYKILDTIGNTLTIANSIHGTGMVNYSYPDFITEIQLGTTDPYFSKQYYLKNTGQPINDGKSGAFGADIKIEGAWALNKGNSNITIAVIDKGVSIHPDLPASRQVRLTGSNLSPYKYGNNNVDNPSPERLSWHRWYHGDGCAGIIAASHDNVGIAGIAPLCKIMPIRLDIGSTNVGESDFVKAINMAANNGAKIINCAWTAERQVPFNFWPLVVKSIENAIAKGCFFAFITGNTANQANGNRGFVGWPSNRDIPGMVVTGASNRYDKQADYSPTDQWVELVAPSAHVGGGEGATEGGDVYTLDIPGDTGRGLNPFNEDVAQNYFPTLGEILPSTHPSDPTNLIHLDYTGRFSGTSAAGPQTAGVAALMLTENSCLSPGQIEDILEATADKVGGYKYSIYNSRGYFQGRSQEFGYGRLNAEKAVKAARDVKKTSVDLYMKDDVTDLGIVRTYNTAFSPDIWIRNQNDGLVNRYYQRPNYLPNTPVYVYVRIRNKSCQNYNPSGNYGKLDVYWSKASTMASYPSNWNGSKPSIGNVIVGNKPIPAIPAGGEVILEIPWIMPGPLNMLDRMWNICILAQISLTNGDATTSYPGNFPMYVGVNNNVTLLNTGVTNLSSGTGFSNLSPNHGQMVYRPKGGTFRLGNPNEITTSYNFTFETPQYTMPNLTDYAEVKLFFDQDGWELFNNAHAFTEVEGVKIISDGVIALTKPSVTLSNISFPADSFVEVYLGFHHWADSAVTDTVWYDYRITQALDTLPDTVQGTCNVQVVAHPRNTFSADAGTDRQINKGQTVMLSATDIGETATYLWYDDHGILVDSVREIEVVPDTTTTYRVEVIATSDDFKDFDEVKVNVKQYFITCISPNPASTTVTVQYDVTNATTASLLFTPINAGPSFSYPLNTSLSSISINTSSYMVGNYIVTLICNGNNVDSKGLLIN
ncbi:MAG: hypothetical protein EOP56_03560 [Sphingobacteriales bacterium]|nr:MAG: hypothetical protein EOP56_03560 [Sphingobacteriales bacterium]